MTTVFDRFFKRPETDKEAKSIEIWHRDHGTRVVEVLKESKIDSKDPWMLQLDNELPTNLKVGSKFVIKEKTYHKLYAPMNRMPNLNNEGLYLRIRETTS